MGVKSATSLAAWGTVGALLGWLVWERLAVGFGALWFVPLAWGATASVAEVGALMAGYYSGALTGAVVALTLFEGASFAQRRAGISPATTAFQARFALTTATHQGYGSCICCVSIGSDSCVTPPSTSGRCPNSVT